MSRPTAVPGFQLPFRFLDLPAPPPPPSTQQASRTVSEINIASVAPCGIWSTPSPAWPTAASSSASSQEAIDTTTPGGKLVFHVFAALAEFERDLIRELEPARGWPRPGPASPLVALIDNGGSIDPIEAALDESSSAGRPPLERQGVQQVLAQVATEIEAARLLVQRASWMGRAGIPLTGGQGSMSKLKSGDVAMWATRTLMDLVGPAAWSKEYPLEKWFRDAKIYQLFEGTAEIQRLVISRMQAEEYRARLAEGAEIAADAIAPAAGNGDPASAGATPPRDAEAVTSANGAGAGEQSKTTA